MARKPEKREPLRVDRSAGRQSRRGSGQLRDAITELGIGEPTKRRKQGGKRRHIDDYREVVLDGAAEGGLADALLQLTQQTHADRSRLLPEERPAVELPKAKRRSRQDVQREAAQAARDLRDQMKEAGIRERTHYYSAVERAETGEIDRTYDLGEPLDEKP
jgi:hypothetical protein